MRPDSSLTLFEAALPVKPRGISDRYADKGTVCRYLGSIDKEALQLKLGPSLSI